MVKDGLYFSMHVSLRYRPYGPNVDIFDIFTGDSEEDALNNLKKYIAMCKEKFGHYVSPFRKSEKVIRNETEGEEAFADQEAASDNNGESLTESPRESHNTSLQPRQGKGAHFIGTTWVAHMETKDKRRIHKSDLEEYLAKGYVKAGPRTKI